MSVSTLRTKLWLMFAALVLALATCLGTGLIPAWGKWYGISLPYRLQTEAMLHGRLALSDSPTDGTIDLAWGRAGVQQVWGLGVPLWRLPFEFIARLFGQEGFPDRLSLLAAFVLFNYVLLRFVRLAGIEEGGFSWFGCSPLLLMPVLLLIFFPPMLNFYQGEFLVYEEAVTYGYLLSTGLFFGLAWLAKNPAPRRYYWLCLLAGFAGLLRPTMLSYGLVTVGMAFGCTRVLKWSWRQSCLGLFCYSAGGFFLLATNWLRYGSPLEFGYGVQLNVFYELRFAAPFKHEPLWSAARELLGSLFFTAHLNTFDWYKAGLVAWQSSTPRWRQFYDTTFDAVYLLALLSGWGVALFQYFRRPQPDQKVSLDIPVLAAAWSFLSFVLLGAFYIRSVVMSSRYVLDFAPAIGIAMACLFWSLDAGLGPAVGRKLICFLMIALCGWGAYEVIHAKRTIGPSKVISQSEILFLLHEPHALKPLPASYKAEENPEKFGIPLNRRGWKHATGETGSQVVLFVENPERLCLKVMANPEAKIAFEDYRQIRAKIGLEELKLESLAPGPESSEILTFAAPQEESYLRGIQVLFLCFAQPGDFARPKSKFRLLSVEWTKPSP